MSRACEGNYREEPTIHLTTKAEILEKMRSEKVKTGRAKTQPVG